MLDATAILSNRDDSDLRLIALAWQGQSTSDTTLRPSGRAALRQATGALDRVAVDLAERLSPDIGFQACVLPEITARTRLRRVPSRFWITFAGPAADPLCPKLYVAFTPRGARAGLFFPNGASGRPNRRFWKAIRSGAPDVMATVQRQLKAEAQTGHLPWNAEGWTLAREAPPADGVQLTSDLGAWLDTRAQAVADQMCCVTISHPISASKAGLEPFAEALIAAHRLFHRTFNIRLLPAKPANGST